MDSVVDSVLPDDTAPTVDTAARGRRKPAAPPPVELPQDLDDWIAQFANQWEWPGMRTKLERTAPEFYNGARIAGFLREQPSEPISLNEIQREFGGGTYVVKVIGPRTLADCDSGNINYNRGGKKVEIAGPPRITAATLPRDQRTGAVLAAGGTEDTNGLAGYAAPAQKGIVDILGDVVRSSREGGGSGGGNLAYRESVNAIQGSAQAQVDAIRQSHEHQVAMLREQTQREAAVAQAAREQLEAERRSFEERLRSTADGSNALLSTLLPVLTQSQTHQQDAILRAADQRLTQDLERNKSELEHMRRMNEQQIENIRTLHAAQQEAVKASYERQLSLLEQQLAASNARVDNLERENTKLRESVFDFYRAKDPMQSLETSSQLLGFMKDMQELASPAKDEDAADDTDMPPWMRLINNALPGINAAAGAVLAKVAGPQAVPGMQPPPQPAQPMQPQPPQQYGLVPAQPNPPVAYAPPAAPMPPPAAQQPPGPAATITVDDIRTAVEILNGAITSGIPVANACNLARSHMDQGMLRVLTSRHPEAVVTELAQKRLLHGPTTTPAGQQYVADMLRELREHP